MFDEFSKDIENNNKPGDNLSRLDEEPVEDTENKENVNPYEGNENKDETVDAKTKRKPKKKKKVSTNSEVESTSNTEVSQQTPPKKAVKKRLSISKKEISINNDLVDNLKKDRNWKWIIQAYLDNPGSPNFKKYGYVAKLITVNRKLGIEWNNQKIILED